jgi:hypothetical protein
MAAILDFSAIQKIGCEQARGGLGSKGFCGIPYKKFFKIPKKPFFCDVLYGRLQKPCGNCRIATMASPPLEQAENKIKII